MATDNKELKLNDKIKVNKRGDTILGVLEGPCADVIHSTRNDRLYDEELWEKVFNDEIINEYFESGGILGELDHPADRTETDTSKVAICMPEKPKKGSDGKLYAKFDILDTPNGRIAYTLAKYGYKLGVSSRGDGDVYEAFDGKEHVDPNSYCLKAFDLVLLPAVKEARLKLKESVGNKTFKQAITESLQRSTKTDQEIMRKTLDNLKIDYKPIHKNEGLIINKDTKGEVNSNKIKTAEITNGAEIIKELQRQIKKNKELTESLQSVQEKLSVCYAKETKYEEKIEELKQDINSKKPIEEHKINSLKSQIKVLTESISERDKTIRLQKDRIVQITESSKADESHARVLQEKYNCSNRRENMKIKQLTESLKSVKDESEEREKSLNESIEQLKKNQSIKAKEYSDKIAKANRIVEHYKKVTEDTLNKYVEILAKLLNVSTSYIKNKLNESYTFEDVDEACEDIRKYQVSISKLSVPITKNNSKDLKLRITESKESSTYTRNGIDDTVDDQLLAMAGLS